VDRCGSWRLRERLPSEGGLEVWDAEHDDGRRGQLRRLPGPVLLMDDEQRGFVDNLARSRTAAHDALLAVLDGGEADRDLFVVTSAPPAGASTLLELRQQVRTSGGLTLGQVLRIGEAIAAALHALHEAGAYHGALHARSVFLTPGDDVLLGRAAVATLAREDPPEPFGAADDVRRLGALLWEALCDRRLLFGAPEPPSRLRADVPPAVDAALVRALADEPHARFASAAAFGEALARARAALEGRAAHSELRPLASAASPTAAATTTKPPAPAPRRLDVPIFAPEPRRGPSPYAIFGGAIALLVAGVFALAGMIAYAAMSIESVTVLDDVEQPVPVPAPAPAPTEPSSVRLSGPGGHSEPLPPPTPTVLQIWLQGCADCMPKFEAVQRVYKSGALAGVPIVNIAFGKADPAWATKYGVADRLVIDQGSAIVQPLGIGTFTTIVMYPNGAWTPVPVVEQGYADALRRALARPAQSGDRRWMPSR
jgi:hypothetical protein